MSLPWVIIVVGEFLVFAGLIPAAASDISRQVISNWLVSVVGAGGVIFRMATAERHGMWASAGAAGILFVTSRLLSGFGALGGGDVKVIDWTLHHDKHHGAGASRRQPEMPTRRPSWPGSCGTNVGVW